MLRRQKYVVKLRRFLKQLEPVDRLRHATFSKLSQASNCFEKVRGSVNIRVSKAEFTSLIVLLCFEKVSWLRQKMEEKSELFRKGLMLRRQKYVAKLRRFLKQLELVDSFKKSLSVAPIVLKKCVATPK